MLSARRSVRSLLAAATLATLAAACNGQEPALTPPDQDQAEVPAAYNEADLAFLQGMRPHHEEAIAMAELVPERTDREQLNQLAEDIVSDQSDEIALFEEMLAEAGVDPEAAPPHDMGGMMGPDAVEELAGLEGEEFERRFMEMMIDHHEGAIEAADQVLDDGQSTGVADLALGIRSAQIHGGHATAGVAAGVVRFLAVDPSKRVPQRRRVDEGEGHAWCAAGPDASVGGSWGESLLAG